MASEAAALPYRPQQGDRIEHVDGRLFAVAEVKPDGTGRARLDVTQLKIANS